MPLQFPSQVHVALPFTSTLHVPLFSQGLLSHGETRNKNGNKCYYSESNTSIYGTHCKIDVYCNFLF
jgi:hypothetical protein